MKLTAEEIKVVEEEIDNWTKNIVGPLTKGRKIYYSHSYECLVWADGEEIEPVPCTYSHSALCQLHFNKVFELPDCFSCVFRKTYNMECATTGSHWNIFKQNPTLETALAMVDALKAIKEAADV